MKMRQLFSSFALAGICLLTASCIDSKSPLSMPEKAEADPELSGVWRCTQDDGGVQYCHIGRAESKLPDGVLWAITTTHAKNGAMTRPDEMPVFSTKIGATRFLNVVTAAKECLDKLEKSGWNADLVGGYTLVKYEVHGDTLTFWFLDPDAKRRAIQAGKIKGTIQDQKPAYFTDTSEKIAALLTAPENADLFTKQPIHYRRVK
jgi:hypothetical protein